MFLHNVCVCVIFISSGKSHQNVNVLPLKNRQCFKEGGESVPCSIAEERHTAVTGETQACVGVGMPTPPGVKVRMRVP